MEGKESRDYQPSKIEFKRKAKSASSTSLLQLGIASVLGLLIIGWLQFGSDVFYYILWLLVPAYLLYRLKSFRKR